MKTFNVFIHLNGFFERCVFVLRRGCNIYKMFNMGGEGQSELQAEHDGRAPGRPLYKNILNLIT